MTRCFVDVVPVPRQLVHVRVSYPAKSCAYPSPLQSEFKSATESMEGGVPSLMIHPWSREHIRNDLCTSLHDKKQYLHAEVGADGPVVSNSLYRIRLKVNTPGSDKA